MLVPLLQCVGQDAARQPMVLPDTAEQASSGTRQAVVPGATSAVRRSRSRTSSGCPEGRSELVSYDDTNLFVFDCPNNTTSFRDISKS